MPNRLPSSSEMLLFSIHVGIEGPDTLLCNRAKGMLQRGRKAPADSDMADSNTSTISPTVVGHRHIATTQLESQKVAHGK